MTGGEIYTRPSLGSHTETIVSVGTGGNLLAAAKTNRIKLVIQNQGSVAVILSKTSGSTTGYSLAAGATREIVGSDEAWYGATGSSTANVYVEEVG